MNLHIVPDNVFINKFYDNLQELSLQGCNKFVVRTNSDSLKYVRHDLPFARLYSDQFETYVGATSDYEKVFVHQFTPLLYRWIATHDIERLCWMIWGADLYNLPSVKMDLYEPHTARYLNRRVSIQDFLYNAKVNLLHRRFRSRAYQKVSDVLTWMSSEFQFALTNTPGLRANHRFFFYENDIPYKEMDKIMSEKKSVGVSKKRPLYVLGNSATPELNHLDALLSLHESGVQADLIVPVSYGDRNYARFLKKQLTFYRGGELRFLDQYMKFPDYLRLLYSSDGLIMNNIRPQGYGNIFMAMYLGKEVFLNAKNISIPDLDRLGLVWHPIEDVGKNRVFDPDRNRVVVNEALSHTKLLQTYNELFS